MSLANERHPGDAHGKVGSERMPASSHRFAKFRQISVSTRSVRQHQPISGGGPPGSHRAPWFFAAIPSARWDLTRFSPVARRACSVPTSWKMPRRGGFLQRKPRYCRGIAELSRIGVPGCRAITTRPGAQNRYFLIGFYLKIDDCSIPGLSRPGPALKIDTFQ